MKYLLFLILSVGCSYAQSTDIFIMQSADFTRPGTRANFNVGIGHSVTAIAKSPVGNEATFSYTYENAGTHGFWHTNYGSHTECIGMMRNFSLTKTVSMYSWMNYGLTSLTGYPKVKNRYYQGFSLGASIHLNSRNAIWIQESYNKITTVPWYTSTGIGYTFSF